MGTCIYCGKPAGLFSHQHKECREQYDNAVTRIFESFKEALTNSMEPKRFRELIEQIAHASSIQEPECKNLISSGFDLLIDGASSDEILSEADENRIDALLSAFGMKLTDLPENTMNQYANGVILRQWRLV
jgi:vacuolar-type H+-ATPase subunit E/Vma4